MNARIAKAKEELDRQKQKNLEVKNYFEKLKKENTFAVTLKEQEKVRAEKNMERVLAYEDQCYEMALAASEDTASKS